MTVEWLLEQLKLAWAVLKTPLVEVSGATLTLSSLIFALFVVALSFRLASAVGRLVNRTLAQRRVDSGVRDSLERFVRYVVILVGCLFSLDLLGFSLNSLAALGAVLMVGVGFGLQNIAQNFISGIIILIERPVKVGDIIRVGGTSGKITEIGVRSTSGWEVPAARSRRSECVPREC